MKYLTLLLIITTLASCNTDNNNQRPNIILILVDDLGKEWISCYGAQDISTPNVDALANNGVMFNNVYSMPQCTPTRLTLMTGQYPFRNGWVNHWDVPRWGGGAHFDETKNPALVTKIREAGYKTCIAGKWQIDDFRVEPDALVKAGFDEYCMWTGWESGVSPSKERYHQPYIFTKEGSKTYKEEFGPDVFKDFIISFIKDNRDDPFFIYYPMVLTHTPFVNTPDEEANDVLGKHKAMVRYTDKIVGQIVKAIDDTGLRDNTVIMFTTDNGTTRRITGTYKNRKVKGGKTLTTENGICEPFIVSWTGKIKESYTSNALIDFSDILPTCLDLAGGDPKAEMTFQGINHIIDGRSFKDVLVKNSPKSNREWILGMGGSNNAKLTENGVENMYVYRDRVLRNEKYKLYIDTKGKPEKFYDLLNDPFEEENIIDKLDTKERKTHYQKLLEPVATFPKKDNDPIYVNNPQQEWDVDISAKSEVWKMN